MQLIGQFGFQATKLQVNFIGMMCKEGVMTPYSKMHDGNGNGNIVFQQLATPNCHHLKVVFIFSLRYCVHMGIKCPTSLMTSTIMEPSKSGEAKCYQDPWLYPFLVTFFSTCVYYASNNFSFTNAHECVYCLFKVALLSWK